jgi:hypothetical protein
MAFLPCHRVNRLEDAYAQTNDDHVPCDRPQRRGVHAHEQEEPGQQDQRPDHREEAVPSDLGNHLAAEDGADGYGDKEGRETRAGGGRGLAQHPLHEQRQVEDQCIITWTRR